MSLSGIIPNPRQFDNPQEWPGTKTQTPRKDRSFMMVASQGLEPQQAESESAVLPLHHEAISLALSVLAGSTGLEPATPGSTVQCANQLRHNPVFQKVMCSISYSGPLAQGGDFQQPAASNQQPAASNQRPAASGQQSVVSDQASRAQPGRTRRACGRS